MEFRPPGPEVTEMTKLNGKSIPIQFGLDEEEGFATISQVKKALPSG